MHFFVFQSFSKDYLEKWRDYTWKNGAYLFGKSAEHFSENYKLKTGTRNIVANSNLHKRPIPAPWRDRHQRQIARHHPALLHAQRMFLHIPCVPLLQSLRSRKVVNRKESFAAGSNETVTKRMGDNPHIHPQINLHTGMDGIRKSFVH